MLTIVMYHYVRPLARSRYPAIKGLDLELFRAQLQDLRSTHSFVTMAEVLAATRREATLPDNAALLTFDDGLRDHYTYALPLLLDVGVQGAFYPPSGPLRDGRLLDVHKVHLVLACTEDPVALATAVDAAIEARRGAPGLIEIANYRAQYHAPSRFDPAPVVYTKRLLQHALPAAVRSAIVDELFARFVTRDEAALAEEWYLSRDQLAAMVKVGMHVGSHGHAHVWLDRLSPAEQGRDIEQSLALLDELGVPRAERTFCYPYGGYNRDTLALLAENGFAAALTTRVGVADLARDRPLELPRLDTNDLLPGRRAQHA